MKVKNNKKNTLRVRMVSAHTHRYLPVLVGIERKLDPQKVLKKYFLPFSILIMEIGFANNRKIVSSAESYSNEDWNTFYGCFLSLPLVVINFRKLIFHNFAPRRKFKMAI
jgi:hypothetical protein